MTGVSVIKRRTLELLWRLDALLPQPLAIWMRNRCWPWRPVLDVVEVHLADACNLNCEGCLHFAPYCRPAFADLDAVARDFAALKETFVTLRHVHLLGGEPLLHPDCAGFLRLTRRMWPTTRLSLVTNGLLLPRQDAAFWAACRETRAMIDLTWYPVMREEELEGIRRRCREEGVVLRVSTICTFMDKTRLGGGEDARASFAACRLIQFCPYLRDGRLYPCATAYHLADRLPSRPRPRGIAVRGSSARAILSSLMTPVEECRYCAARPSEVPWRRAGNGISGG